MGCCLKVILDKPSLLFSNASAAYFFQNNDRFAICDEGASDDVVTSLTKKINGGANELADRIALFQRCYDSLSPIVV
jgi:putative chitinase